MTRHKPSQKEIQPMGGQFTGRYAHIVGWGKAVPERILSNADLEAVVDTSDAWIRERTGIAERRIADVGETTSDLAFKAAKRALEVANILPTAVDLIIVATSTPEHIFPSTASLVQDRLGAGRAGAFDLSAACSGFVYGLDMASAKIRAGDIHIAVVIGAETMSRVINWSDRGTCVLFGDGAGAFVLMGSEIEGGILSSVLRSDGAGWDLLGLPTVGSRDVYLPQRADILDEGGRPNYALHRLHMNGREIYRFATRVVAESVREVAEHAGLTVEDISLIVPHQANQRIIDQLAKQLKLPEERIYSNVARYGNTSAASIPLATVEALEEGRIGDGDVVAFVGFGGGLTWAAMTVKWRLVEVKVTRVLGFQREAIYRYAVVRRRALRFWARLAGWWRKRRAS
jgi:3-oxoacyl-[acyl-carrier-protein] synthase-3